MQKRGDGWYAQSTVQLERESKRMNESFQERPAIWPPATPHLAVLQKQPRASAPSVSSRGVSCRPGCIRASPLQCCGSPYTWHTAFEDRAETE